MQLSIGSAFTKFLATPNEEKLLKDTLRYKPEGYFWAPSYKQGFWDGYVKLCTKTKFLTGFVPRVQELCEQFKYSCATKFETFESAICDNIDGLYDYQAKFVEQMNIQQRCVISSPTGTGKSYLIAHFVANSIRPALVLCYTNFVKEQLTKMIRERGLNVRNDFKAKADAYVTTVQYFSKNSPNLINEHKIAQIHVDECHHIPADLTKSVLSIANAFPRFGYSATPYRTGNDDLLIEGLIGPKTFGGKLQVENITLEFVSVSSKKRYMNYEEARKDGIIWKSDRNEMIVKKVKELIRNSFSPILIFVRQIEHGNNLFQLLSEIDRVFIWSGTRKRITEKHDVYIVSPCGFEGLDFPEVRGIINASGGESSVEIIQKLGRSLRKKDAIHFVDFLDDGRYLRSHSLNRKKTIENYVRLYSSPKTVVKLLYQ